MSEFSILNLVGRGKELFVQNIKAYELELSRLFINISRHCQRWFYWPSGNKRDF